MPDFTAYGTGYVLEDTTQILTISGSGTFEVTFDGVESLAVLTELSTGTDVVNAINSLSPSLTYGAFTVSTPTPAALVTAGVTLVFDGGGVAGQSIPDILVTSMTGTIGYAITSPNTSWTPTGAILPTKFVLPYREPVYNQGHASNSPALAVASLKAQHEFREHRAYFDFDVDTWVLSVTGQTLADAMSLLVSYGYLAKQEVYKLDNAFPFPATTPTKLADLTDIKEALLTGNPVLLGVGVDVGLATPDALGVLPEPLGVATDAQAFVVYGWDDSKELEVGTGALLLKNSWGKEYGLKGFVWMGYNYITTYNFDAWVAIDSADTLP